MWDIESQTAHLYSNSKLRENLWSEVLSNRGIAHHALIFSGMQGLGKAQMAGQIASVILGAAQYENADQVILDTNSPAYRQLLRGSHADFLYISPEKYDNKSATIPMEAASDIQQFLIRQGNSARRIVIIDAIDECVFNLQHALLKQLEEPQAGVLFILIAHRPGKVLETIRSRARHYRFSALNFNEMHKVAAQLYPDDLNEQALFIAGGCPGQLNILYEADLEGILERFLAAMDDADPNSPALHDFAQFISHPKHQHLEAFCLWAKAFHQVCTRGQYTEIAHLPEEWYDMVQCFASVLGFPSRQNTFSQSLTRLEGIQTAPMYLDPASTMMHIAYTWHSLLHPQSP